MGVPHGAAHTRNSRRNLICAILRDYVSASGYSVIEAADGADSIAKAPSERPDLVLKDPAARARPRQL